MSSDRHISSQDAVPERLVERPATDIYLDAARACLLDVGWRRTTLTEVARRASVSRMTIYRAWPDMGTLLGDLMTREWESVMAGIAATESPLRPTPAPTPEGIAEAMATCIESMRTNDLFRRILDVDPELILPYLFVRRGRSQQSIIDVLAAFIANGQQAGTLRDGNPEHLARTLVLAAHGLTLSARTMTDEATSLTDLDRQFVALVTAGLAP